jgi:hypothetical protein
MFLRNKTCRIIKRKLRGVHACGQANPSTASGGREAACFAQTPPIGGTQIYLALSGDDNRL